MTQWRDGRKERESRDETQDKEGAKVKEKGAVMTERMDGVKKKKKEKRGDERDMVWMERGRKENRKDGMKERKKDDGGMKRQMLQR